VAVDVCPAAFAAKTAQWAKVRIDQPEKVGYRKKSRSFITRDSSAETAIHKKLDSTAELLVLTDDGSKSMQGRIEADAIR
jgi:hypothetical protein